MEFEYELIDITFEQLYEIPQEDPVYAREESLDKDSADELDACDRNGIPMGDRPEDIEKRRNIISTFYHNWKENNPEQRKYNLSLKEYISIRFVSITETCTHACRSYRSTLAVLQLDTILAKAKKVKIVPAKNNGNQKPFDKMMIMQYNCDGIGNIKMTVGIRRRTHEKVQYCITTSD